jgi:hypothetical protein
MILYFLLGAIVLLIIGAVAGTRESNQKAKLVGERILKMEEKYAHFVDNYIAGHILQKNDFGVNVEELIEDALVVIHPDIKGIIMLTKSKIYTTITIDIVSDYFPNLVSLAENFFNKNQKNKLESVAKDQELVYLEAAREAIAADVKKRLIDLNVKNW